MSVHKMKFAWEHIRPILLGDKWRTIRLAEEWHDVKPQDVLLLADPDDSIFARATVENIGEMTVFDAASLNLDGHRTYPNAGVLCEEMRGYYPDKNIGPNTPVRVIAYGDLDPVDHHRYVKETMYDRRYQQ